MELTDYLRVIDARKWIIIQAVVVVTVVAIVASALQDPLYEAETKVLIQEKGSSQALFGDLMPALSSQPERSIMTQVSLMKLRPLAERVIRKLGLRTTADALLGQITVETSPQTNIVNVTARSDDPQMAAKIADQVAEEFVDWSRKSKRRALAGAAEQVDYKVKQTEEQLIALAGQVHRSDDTTSAAAPAQVQAQLSMAGQLYVMLAEKREQLEINEAMEEGAGEIVSPAVVPAVPVSPQPVRNGVLGLVLGAALGVGFAFLFEYTDNTLKSAGDAEKYFGVPVLSQIPEEPGVLEAPGPSVVVAGPGKELVAEAYRVLRTSVNYLNFDHSIRSLLVTSAKPREGKSTNVANLAVVMAQAGCSVIVLCCDLRRPSLHKAFGVDGSAGLTNVLTGGRRLEEVMWRIPDLALHVVPAGPVPPNPSELLHSKQMDDLLEEARSRADFVLLDTPPVMAVTDSAVLAPKVDGVIVSAAAGETTKEEAAQVAGVLRGENVRLLGVVLNKVPLERSHGYMYYYGYGAGSGHVPTAKTGDVAPLAGGKHAPAGDGARQTGGERNATEGSPVSTK